MRILVVLFPIMIIFSLSSLIYSLRFPTDGSVLELNATNFDAAISSFDYIFVDFYAPWCYWSKRLAPELDKAAVVLAELQEPIVIAKIDVGKRTPLAIKYEITGYPTLKLFIHGVPIDYYGNPDSNTLVESLNKLVALKDVIFNSHSTI